MSSQTDYWCRISLPWWWLPGQADRTCPSLCRAEIDRRFASIFANRAPSRPGPLYNRRYNPRHRHCWGFCISCRSLSPARPPNRLSINSKIDCALWSDPRRILHNIIYRVLLNFKILLSKTSYIMNQHQMNMWIRFLGKFVFKPRISWSYREKSITIVLLCLETWMEKKRK